MKKKKILFGLFLAVGAISLASCGKKENKKDDNTKTSIVTSQRVNDSSTSINEDITSSTSKDEDITSSTLTNQQKTVTYKDPYTNEIIVLNTDDGVVSGLPSYEDKEEVGVPFITTTKFKGWLVDGTENDYISNGTRLKMSVNVVADFEEIKTINKDISTETSVISYKDELKEVLEIDESNLVGFSFYNAEFTQTYRKENGVYKCLKSDITSSSDEDIVGNLFNKAGFADLSLAKAIEIYSKDAPLYINENGFVLLDYEGDVIYKFYYNFDGYCRKMECYVYNSSTQEETYSFTTYYTFFLERQATDEEIDKICGDIYINAPKIYVETEDENRLCHNVELAKNTNGTYSVANKSDDYFDGKTFDFDSLLLELYFEYGSEIFYIGNEYIRCAIGGNTYLFNLDGSLRSIDEGTRKTTFSYDYEEENKVDITYSKFVSSLFNGFEAKSLGLVVSDGSIKTNNLYILGDEYALSDLLDLGSIDTDALRVSLASGFQGVLNFICQNASLDDVNFYKFGNYYQIEYIDGDYRFEFDFNELGQLKYLSSTENESVDFEIFIKPSLQQYSRVKVINENNPSIYYYLNYEKFCSELEFDHLEDEYDTSNDIITRFEYYDLDTNEPVENGQIIDKYLINIVARQTQIEGCKCIIHQDYYDMTNSKTILLDKGKIIKDVLKDLNLTGFEFGGWYTDSDFQNPLDMDQEVNSEIEIYAKLTSLTYSEYSIDKINHFESFNLSGLKPTNLGCVRASGVINVVDSVVTIKNNSLLEFDVAPNAIVSYQIVANKTSGAIPLYAVDKPTNLQLQNDNYYYIKDGKLISETGLVARDVQYYKAFTTTEFSQSGSAITILPSTKNRTILLAVIADSTFNALRIVYNK